MQRGPKRWVTFGGFVLATSGMALYLRLGSDSTYAANILPSIVLMSLGMGLIFVPLSATALFGVGNHDAGVASAVLNTAQQIGGSIGLAFLNTIAASATTAYIVSNQLQVKPDSRVLVFTQYRDTCDMVTNLLSRIEGARVTKLIGQSGRGSDKGLRQKEQIGVLQRFRDGEFNVVVATSVGEEGLDVANTDLVIFYEPVPSEIRSIQRRGRTGRSRD